MTYFQTHPLTLRPYILPEQLSTPLPTATATRPNHPHQRDTIRERLQLILFTGEMRMDKWRQAVVAQHAEGVGLQGL